HHASPQAEAPPPAAATAAATAPPPPFKPPERPASEKLAEARLLLAQGDDFRARAALRTLSFADQGALPLHSCEILGSIEETLALTARQHLPEDLAKGLETGDLGRLQSAVAAGAGQEVPAPLRGNLERARNIVACYEQAQAAASHGSHALVLEQFRLLSGLVKDPHDPEGLRAKAAAAVEAEADGLARDGRYAEALQHLEPVRRTWPERSGLKDRVKSFESAQQNEARQESVLATVPAYERRRKPAEALDLMRGVTPTPHLEQRWNEALQQLQASLAQLDANPPRVVLRDGYALDYPRGTVATLSFRATDDYEVRSVKMMARPESGRWQEMPLQKDGQGYTVHIPPSFHQNGTVEFYVAATDLSGHEGFLGSRDQPLRLKRQAGFHERLVR
ncbi:MAG: hypothetical protein M3O15_09830, partial [Acidobacteriota bacterium]|nr:hypothetical protein [Acidobacteriota bacterium]